ncbi:type II secretory pathway component [Rheinheimera sediminis]|uniref:pilus assembly PilX N-terminal domain-containing protein n=1 Tax=Rheinheimera sp. YQF-1 TaxID=2499626 RepID=UPI000FD77BDB|nr:pilus assembly PilX N-terminal domain-containing protein [Rheinheimera sp. YQF-1]RVT45977.1 type II secretory pathway component [Rheinheimera sp. YQF-1]
MVALFIIVVMGLLVAALSRLVISSSSMVSTEVLGARAFFAAQSGLELGLAELYPLQRKTSASDSTAIGEPMVCEVKDYVFSVAGLAQCKAQVSCVESDDTNTGIRHYYLTSIGSCGEGSYTSSRTLEMEVWQ